MKDLKLQVVDVIELEDGTSKVIFDISEEGKKEYMEQFSLKEWDDEHFQQFVLDALTHYSDRIMSEKNTRNPDFLWSKGNDE